MLKMLKNLVYPQLPYKICSECEDLESDHDESIKGVYQCTLT